MAEHVRKLSTSTQSIVLDFQRLQQKRASFGFTALDGFAAPAPFAGAGVPPPAAQSAAEPTPTIAAPPPRAPPAGAQGPASSSSPFAAAATVARSSPHASPRAVRDAAGLHARMAQFACSHAWGEQGEAILSLVEPREEGEGGHLQMEALPSDDEYSAAMGVGVAQVKGKLRLAALVAVAPVGLDDGAPLAAYAGQLASLRDELTAELAEFLGDNGGMAGREGVFDALATAVKALLLQRLEVQRVAAKQGGPGPEVLFAMEDVGGAVLYDEEQWEAAEAQYALLNELLRCEKTAAAKEAAAGGAGGSDLVRLLLELLDSGDDRERECVSDLLAMAWEEGLFQDAVVSQVHTALWAYAFDDRGRPWHPSAQYIYRLLQVLCSCVDEGQLSARQYGRVFALLGPLHVPDGMPEYLPQLKRAARLLLKHVAASADGGADGGGDGDGDGDGDVAMGGAGASAGVGVAAAPRNVRLARLVCDICQRWPISGTAKQIALLGEVEELLLTSAEWAMRGPEDERRAQLDELRPCFMPFARKVAQCLRSGLQLMARALELIDQHSIALGQVMHEVFIGDGDVLQFMIDTIGDLAEQHFSADIKPQFADMCGRLKHLQADKAAD